MREKDGNGEKQSLLPCVCLCGGRDRARRKKKKSETEKGGDDALPVVFPLALRAARPTSLPSLPLICGPY